MTQTVKGRFVMAAEIEEGQYYVCYLSAQTMQAVRGTITTFTIGGNVTAKTDHLTMEYFNTVTGRFEQTNPADFRYIHKPVYVNKGGFIL